MRLDSHLRHGLAAIAGVLAPAHALVDLHVDQANPNCPGDGTAADPYCLIQDAINAASDGDVVHVAPGTYYENLVVELRDITLIATDGPHATTVDAGGVGSAIVFRNANGSTPLFEGFTLSSGTGTDGRGGGVFVDGASPTLRDCIITNNHTLGRGGGIYARNLATLVLESCLLQFNSTAIDGGGLFQAGGNLTLTDCTTHWNTATDNGGGLFLDSINGLHIDSTLFLTNIARQDGGAVYAENCSNSTFTYCAFARNRCVFGRGAAFHLNSSSPLLDHCTLTLNQAALEDCAIYGRNLSMPAIKNSILWGDTGEELILVIGHKPPGTGGSTTDISFTDVQGSWPGANNLNIDPDFASPLTNNFRLRATSPVRGMADDGSDLGAYPFGS
jgi:predicted outer membrane repeat protein